MTHAGEVLSLQSVRCMRKDLQFDAERHLVSEQDVLVEALRQRCGLCGAHDEQHPAAADETGGQVQRPPLHGRMQSL